MKKEVAVLLTAVLCGIAGVGHAATPLRAIISSDHRPGDPGKGLQIVHASPDAGPVDVWIGGVLTFRNVQFEGITPFADISAGATTVSVTPAGGTTPLLTAYVDPAWTGTAMWTGTNLTMVITGLRASISAQVVGTAAPAPTASEALVRVFHASPDTPTVWVDLLPGPSLSGYQDFGDWVHYAWATAGTYTLEVRTWEGIAPLELTLTVPGVTFAAGGVYTVYLTGLRADIGAAPSRTLVPVAARGYGYPGSFWSTDVDVQNAGPTAATFTYEWLPRNSDNARPLASQVFTLNPGQALRHTDVLAAAFGFADGSDAFGALAVVSDSEHLLLYSRTSVRADGSSSGYGMAVPGIAADQLIPANTRRRILAFSQDDDFRSNLGLLNGTAVPITVKWERFTADGVKVGEGSADLPAWGNTQLNRVFLGEAPIAAAYVDIWTETAGGAFAAYGSVVDNVTSDPVLVLPQ